MSRHRLMRWSRKQARVLVSTWKAPRLRGRSVTARSMRTASGAIASMAAVWTAPPWPPGVGGNSPLSRAIPCRTSAGQTIANNPPVVGSHAAHGRLDRRFVRPMIVDDQDTPHPLEDGGAQHICHEARQGLGTKSN